MLKRKKKKKTNIDIETETEVAYESREYFLRALTDVETRWSSTYTV